MSEKPWGKTHAQLIDKLANVPAVQKAGVAEQNELSEATLAHALLDIDEECRAFTNEYLPQLLKAESVEELSDALTDIRDGLRHLAYHLKDSPYLREILDD